MVERTRNSLGHAIPFSSARWHKWLRNPSMEMQLRVSWTQTSSEIFRDVLNNNTQRQMCNSVHFVIAGKSKRSVFSCVGALFAFRKVTGKYMVAHTFIQTFVLRSVFAMDGKVARYAHQEGHACKMTLSLRIKATQCNTPTPLLSNWHI